MAALFDVIEKSPKKSLSTPIVEVDLNCLNQAWTWRWPASPHILPPLCSRNLQVKTLMIDSLNVVTIVTCYNIRLQEWVWRWYGFSWVCNLYSRWPYSSATWITAFALFVPFWTANRTSPTVSKPLYISSRYLISPEATLGGISSKNAARCFASRWETINPYILIDLLTTSMRFWKDDKVRKRL